MANKINSLFIVGSGITKAIFPNAPLNADLLPNLIAEGASPTIAFYYKKYATDDIEKLLTDLDLDAGENPQTKADRAKINAELSVYFSKFRYSQPDGKTITWLETFAKKLLKPHDAILTLNYDCFLEGALDNYEVWTPNGGYAQIGHFFADSIPKNPKGIVFYKIHGSEHFVESSIADNQAQSDISFIIDSSVYPKSGKSRHFGGGIIDPRSYIIAPSFIKIPHVKIAAMMLQALTIAEAAKNLIIIGCGMRPEDNFLWLLLTRFIKREPDRKRLVIVDPLSQKIWNRIAKYWIGDICEFAKVCLIPGGVEESLENLLSFFGEERE
jgi:hypothetical protein